jgi:hypothetical protein
MSRFVASRAAHLIDKKENLQEVEEHATDGLEPEA